MAECILCGGTGGGELMSPVFYRGTTPPTNINILWIDTNPTTGGLKCWNGASWVHVPVAYT